MSMHHVRILIAFFSAAIYGNDLKCSMDVLDVIHLNQGFCNWRSKHFCERSIRCCGFSLKIQKIRSNIFFCKSVVNVSTNASIEWLDVPIVVSSANMSAQVLVSERGGSFT